MVEYKLFLALCTAMALPITGHRRVSDWRLLMEPPPGEAWRTAVVDRVRKVEGEVFFMKGHMLRDWRRRASIAATEIVRSDDATIDAGRGKGDWEEGNWGWQRTV